jgi:glucosamine kinase
VVVSAANRNEATGAAAPQPGVRFYLGVDGGGTGCRTRLTDLEGHVLGHGSAGPANLVLGLDLVNEAIMQATRQALEQAALDEAVLAQTRAGLGIAAANVRAHRQALEAASLPFLSFAVCSDAQAACLGAHGGEDGGVLILGTGSQGIVLKHGAFSTVGGWGFVLSDFGSGAILGRAAVRRAFLANEGIEPASPLTQRIMERFQADAQTTFEWASRAHPRDWAAFARLVFEQAGLGDPVALELVHASAADADRMLDRMVQLGATRISLMGGIASPTRPYMAKRFEPVIVEPKGDAMDGALWLARREQPTSRIS